MRPEKQTSFLSSIDEAIQAEGAEFVGSTTHDNRDSLFDRNGTADLTSVKQAAIDAGAKDFQLDSYGPGTFGVNVYFCDAPDLP
jgi:hypothetical protein